MISRHFALSSELAGAITKKLPHAKNQVSGPDSFFNQFVTDIYIYIYGSFHVKSTNSTNCSTSSISEILVILPVSFAY